MKTTKHNKQHKRPIIKRRKRPVILHREEKTNDAKRQVRPRIAVKARPKIVIERPDIPDRVFVDNHRFTYLLIDKQGAYGRFLTHRDDEIKVVKLHAGSPVRDVNGHLPEETTHIDELTLVEGYGLRKAVKKYDVSLLPRSNDAVKAICEILGKPVPKAVLAAIEQRRSGAVRMREGLAAARKRKKEKNGKRVITIIAKANPYRAGTKRAALFALYANGMTVTDYIDAGGANHHVKYDAASGYIRVEEISHDH